VEGEGRRQVVVLMEVTGVCRLVVEAMEALEVEWWRHSGVESEIFRASSPDERCIRTVAGEGLGAVVGMMGG